MSESETLRASKMLTCLSLLTFTQAAGPSVDIRRRLLRLLHKYLIERRGKYLIVVQTIAGGRWRRQWEAGRPLGKELLNMLRNSKEVGNKEVGNMELGNMEGKEVVTTKLANMVGKSTVRVVEGIKWMWDKWVKWELRLERIHL